MKKFLQEAVWLTIIVLVVFFVGCKIAKVTEGYRSEPAMEAGQRAGKLTIGEVAPDETIFTDDKGWSSYVTILADENNEGGLQFYIGKETGRLQVVMDGNTDMDEAAEIFFDNILKPMVDEYIEKRLKQ